jgi:hypothetical protein
MSMADNSSPDRKSVFLQAENRRKQAVDEGRREKERREQAEDEGRKEKERQSTDHFHGIHTPVSQITDKGAADLADIMSKDERLRDCEGSYLVSILFPWDETLLLIRGK